MGVSNCIIPPSDRRPGSKSSVETCLLRILGQILLGPVVIICPYLCTSDLVFTGRNFPRTGGFLTKEPVALSSYALTYIALIKTLLKSTPISSRILVMRTGCLQPVRQSAYAIYRFLRRENSSRREDPWEDKLSEHQFLLLGIKAQARMDGVLVCRHQRSSNNMIYCNKYNVTDYNIM